MSQKTVTTKHPHNQTTKRRSRQNISTDRHCHYIWSFILDVYQKCSINQLGRDCMERWCALWQVLDGEPREYLVNPPPRFDTLWVVCLQLKIEHRTKCLLLCSLWRHLYLPDFALHLLFYCWLLGQNPKFLADVVFRFSTAWCHIRMLSRLITK